jgi:transposase
VIKYPYDLYKENYDMNRKYLIELSTEEQQQLQDITTKGKASARKIKRAQILLMANGLAYQDKAIAEHIGVSTSTIYRTKRDFVEQSLEQALEEGSRSGQPRKLNATNEALLVSLACSKPPQGCCKWTLELLTDEFIALLDDAVPISIETVRRRLKDNALKPWQKKMWCLSDMNAEYIAQMEHILTLYKQPANPDKPVVNFDEAMKQLVSETKVPVAMKPGQVGKQDYEYKREGMANIYLFFDRHQGWRKAKVTTHKKAADFAQCMKDLVDIHYPNAEKIQLVMDNYNTHRAASLYKTFPAAEARRIMDKLEFHYTPKHASWLNMVEIEIGNMNQQCLDRRIGDRETLISELAAWEQRRNNKNASINWMFDVEAARGKLNKAYSKAICQN